MTQTSGGFVLFVYMLVIFNQITCMGSEQARVFCGALDTFTLLPTQTHFSNRLIEKFS